MAEHNTPALQERVASPILVGRVLTRLLLLLIRAYQRAISPLFGNVCRFEPSCSRYAAACVQSHGPWRGSLLSVVRLCKCHPFHPGGVDLPPPPPGSRP